MLRRLIPILILVALVAGCAPRSGTVKTVPSQEASEIFTLANTYYNNNLPTKALQHYLAVLERFPQSPEAPLAALKIARIYYKKKQLAKSAYYFEWMISRFPDHPESVEAHYFLGVCRQQLDKHDAAITAFGYYIHVDGAKRVNDARLRLADCYTAAEKYHEALRYYAAAPVDLSKAELIDALKKARWIIDEKLAPAELLTLIPALPDGPVADFARYRAAQDLIAQARRDEAAKVLNDISFSQPIFPFYEKAEQLLAVAQSRTPTAVVPNAGDAGLDTPLAPLPSQAQFAVGILLPLSGSRAVFGREVLHGLMQGADLFRVESAGNYRMVIRDTEGDPETAARLVDELADDPSILALVGPLLGKCAAAAAEVAERRAVPLLTLTTREDILEARQWTFRNFLTASEQVRTLIRYATDHQGALRFGVLYPDTAPGRRYYRLFESTLNRNRFRITAVASYAADETDFRHVVSNLRAQGDFDALFIPDNARRVALLAPQLVYYGVKNVMLLGINSWNDEDLARKAGSYLTRSVFVTGFFPRSRQNLEVARFVSTFEDTFQHEPSFLAAVGYDTARMIGDVMRHDVRDRVGMRRQLFRVRDFAGVTGDLTIDETRDTRRRLYLLRVGESGIEELL
ncbi:MAG: penicillin-binding protein activator [Candidatus Lernaella stagnicola]|nr:penicillin-binding protein activator [Candidatus Lernaella stagnicola]